MSTFRNKLLSLIDDSSSKAKSLIDEFADTVSAFDWDANLGYLKECKEELLKKGAELYSEFNTLMKQVKDSITDFVVTIPYNEDEGEKLEYHVDGNVLHVTVSYKDETMTRSNKTEVTLPVNCDIEAIKCEIDKATSKAKIIVPKLVKEIPTEENEPQEEEKKVEVPTLDEMTGAEPTKCTHKKKPKTAEAPKVKTPKCSRKKKSAEVMESAIKTASHISEKLLSKVDSNAKKFVKHYEESGRFVRKEPTATAEE